MSESPEGSVASDLPTSSEDSEALIAALSSKISKLKALLVKAKVSINDYKRKAELQEKRIEEERQLGEMLRDKLLKLEEAPGVEDVICVKARVKVEDEVWLLLRTMSAGNRWFPAANVHLPTSSLPDLLDSTCSQKHLSDVAKQYEDKLQRMQVTIGHHEDTISDLQHAYKSLQDAYKAHESSLPAYFHSTLQPSQSLLETLTSWVTDHSLSPDFLPQIQQSTLSFPATSDNPLQQHLTQWHSLVMDVARRAAHSKKEQVAQESAWRATCDSLVNEKEEIKGSLNRVRNDFARKIEEYDRKIAGIVTNNSVETNELKGEIRKLQAEAKSGVNTAYLRHVLVQFLTSSDVEMQEKLIHVLSTVLEFSQEDKVAVRRQRTPKGVLTRWLGA